MSCTVYLQVEDAAEKASTRASRFEEQLGAHRLVSTVFRNVSSAGMQAAEVKVCVLLQYVFFLGRYRVLHAMVSWSHCSQI